MQTPYQVLARKYRPATFADLIGQEAMVRTLGNAFSTDRIAHAFLLTGVRGVGKTTTARIVAKGLNCVGPDGNGGPTITPCGMCEPCRAIAEGRHVDVLEMDAASRTGVGDIREIVDSVAYRAASARYKVYIIDEVHMLSTSAFNALLKTLEEPPAHVKFLFATTEIRKVPVTVLSRCQRFDLRRIEPEVMMAHLRGIAAAEGVAIEDGALALLTRAAEGSVRDALSLLDQAIAHGAGRCDAGAVRVMLGLADRGRVLDLFEAVMRGDAAAALAELAAQYADGVDPAAVLRDLAEVTHWVSIVKIAPQAADDPTVSPDERARGLDFAGRLGIPALTRAWAMLLKALEEVAVAPNALMAAEMALIRLTHVADLPTPDDLVRRLTATTDGRAEHPPAGAGGPGPSAGVPRPVARMQTSVQAVAQVQEAAPVQRSPAPQAALAPARSDVAPEAQPVGGAAGALAAFAQFEDVLALIRQRRDMRLLWEVEQGLRLVRYAPGIIEFEPTAEAAPDLAAKVSARLGAWTGARWNLVVVSGGGAPSVAEAREATRLRLLAEASRHPLVQAVLLAFPGAELRDVRQPEAVEEIAAPDHPEPDWDPDDPFTEEF